MRKVEIKTAHPGCAVFISLLPPFLLSSLLFFYPFLLPYVYQMPLTAPVSGKYTVSRFKIK